MIPQHQMQQPILKNQFHKNIFFEYSFLKYIKNDETFLEKEPLEKLSKEKKLVGYKHTKFWQCMDTLRDKEILETAFKKNKF